MPMNPDLLRSQVGILGVICSVALFVSHIPTYRDKILKKEASVELSDEFPSKNHDAINSCIFTSHLVLILPYASWILYGSPFVTQGNYLFAISNGIGFAIELIYIIIRLVYAKKKQRLYVCIVLVCEVLAGLMFGLHAAGLSQDALLAFTGGASVLLDIYANILYWMFQSPQWIHSTKSFEQYASSWPILANMHNSMIWVIFGSLTENPIHDGKGKNYDDCIVAPYVLRCFLYSVAMLIWYVVYCVKSTAKRSDPDYGPSSAKGGNDVKGDTEENKYR